MADTLISGSFQRAATRASNTYVILALDVRRPIADDGLSGGRDDRV